MSGEVVALTALRPRPDGREQRSVRTRARIFEAALAEFRRVGFESASVARITRAAGVSRPSFYFHFPTKEHVLLELQWQLEQEVAKEVAAESDAIAAMHAFADRLVTLERDVGSGELFRDILQLWTRRPGAVEHAGERDPGMREADGPVVREIVRRLEQHAAHGGRLAVAPPRAAVLFLSGVFGYLLGVTDDEGRRAEELHALVRLHLGEAP